MGLASVTVGADQRLILVTGDPETAAQMQNVLALADAQSLSGKYASLAGAAPWLLNSSGLYDRARSAVGTTGIPAVNTEGTKACYSASTFGFLPVATPTDFWQIIGSATKTVRVTRLAVSGFATAAISVDLLLIKRSAASTVANLTVKTAAQHDSNDAAPTAVVNAFTENASALGATAGTVRAHKQNLGATGAAGLIVWDFSTRNSKGIVLRAAAQSLNLNWNGIAVPAGTLLNIDVEWTEE